MTNPLFHLLQVCDSNFPSGAFSHSFGLETYIQEEKIMNKDTFLNALKQYIVTQFVFTDGLACKMAYQAIEGANMDAVWELDQELFALGNSKETREGNRRVGRQLVKVMNELYCMDILKDYEASIKRKQSYGHSAIVFAMVCEGLEVDLPTTLSVYLFASTSSMVQNAVRGIPLGQTDGQRILLEIQPFLIEQVNKIVNLTKEEFGAAAPGLEIAQMKHEQLTVRLFMS